jgi:hypothetical protein
MAPYMFCEVLCLVPVEGGSERQEAHDMRIGEPAISFYSFEINSQPLGHWITKQVLM